MVRYSIIINRKANDEYLLYTQAKTWMDRKSYEGFGPSKIYIYGTVDSYGFKYALLSVNPDVEFITEIPNIDDDFLVIREPYNYIDIDQLEKKLESMASFSYEDGIYPKGIYHNVGIKTCLLHSRNLNDYTPDTMTFYHLYKKDWVALTSQTPYIIIPEFPLFCDSIKLSDLKFLSLVVGMLSRRYPKRRKIYLPYKSTEYEVYTKCGFDLIYDDQITDIDLYVGDILPVDYSRYRSMLIYGSTPNIEGYTLKDRVYMRNDYHQRRVVVTSYFNEPEMLNLHVKELYQDFDSFIIGQMDTPYSSNNLIEQDIPYVDDPDSKVIRVLGKYPQEIKDLGDSWIKDKYWRQLSVYHESIDPYDLLFILDIDEIPKVSTIREYCTHNVEGTHRLLMNFHYYNLNWVKRNKWYHTYLGSVDRIRSIGADNIRVSRNVQITGLIHNAGWHLSYFMSPERIALKIDSFAHQEYNKEEYTNLEHVKKCIEQGKDLFNRNYEDLIPADPDDRPVYSNLLPEYLK